MSVCIGCIPESSSECWALESSLFWPHLVRRLVQPLPVLDLQFLNTRNIIVVGLSIFVFKFAQLATLVLVPSFLENIHDYRPLQIGDALAWVALPMFVTVWVIAIVVVFTNSRLILALGLTLAAVVCWHYSRIDSSWAANSFEIWELLLSVGFACSYVGLVSSLILEAIQGGAMTSLAKAATVSGYAHFIRLFGGEVGVRPWRISCRHEKSSTPICWACTSRAALGSRTSVFACSPPALLENQLERKKHNIARPKPWAYKFGHRRLLLQSRTDLF